MSSFTDAKADGKMVFNSALIIALVGQIILGVFWAGGINAQMSAINARVSTVEVNQARRGAALSDISVKLGRIEQKLQDIGHAVGSTASGSTAP